MAKTIGQPTAMRYEWFKDWLYHCTEEIEEFIPVQADELTVLSVRADERAIAIKQFVGRAAAGPMTGYENCPFGAVVGKMVESITWDEWCELAETLFGPDEE